MSNKCNMPGRNLCARNGKVAALFIDLDGTILECQPHFDSAIERFGFLMAMCGFDKKHAITTLREIDLSAVHINGFERDRFPTSMIAAYAKLCKEKKLRRRREITLICEDMGNSPFFRQPKLFANAAAVLGRAHHNFLMIAVTIGNREAQKYKIRQGGLDPVFDEVIVTPNDDKAERVREAIIDLNIDAEMSAFIGNSRRSDGSCLTETNFIYLPLEKGWSFDETDLPANTGHDVFSVTDWREAEDRAITRLLRKREREVTTTHGEDCACGS
jgi:FMN phosphatase YigB (HAD superfamily)